MNDKQEQEDVRKALVAILHAAQEALGRRSPQERADALAAIETIAREAMPVHSAPGDDPAWDLTWDQAAALHLN